MTLSILEAKIPLEGRALLASEVDFVASWFPKDASAEWRVVRLSPRVDDVGVLLDTDDKRRGYVDTKLGVDPDKYRREAEGRWA